MKRCGERAFATSSNLWSTLNFQFGFGLGTRDLGEPYQPSMVLIAVTAFFS